jgi:hypothetical protein
MIKNKSKNLFDKGSVLLDTGINTSGVVSSSPTRHLTDFISVLPNTAYIGSGTYTQVVLVYYDSNKTFISAVNTPTKLFTTPANTFYVRFSINSTVTVDYDTVQLELGSTATAYVPYNDIQVAVGQFEQGQGKNLFSSSLELGEISSSTGQNVVNSNAVRSSSFMEIEPNTNYIVSSSEGSIRSYQYDENFNYINTVGGIPFTSFSNAKYIKVRFLNTNNLNLLAQLELGNTATAYEPFKYLAIHNLASNDIPIPALNNKTLNEVFVGGNAITNPYFENGTTGWSSSLGTLSVNNKILSITGNGLFSEIYINNTNATTFSPTGDVWFYSQTVKINVMPTSISFRAFNGVTVRVPSTIPNPQLNVWHYMSGISNWNGNIGSQHRLDIGLSGFSSNAIQGTATIQVDGNVGLYAINLTSLGIASQTQAQMDAYFQAWQRNNAGTLLANTFIQHDQNSVPIADLNGKTLDEVFIGGQLLLNPKFDTNTNYEFLNGSISNGILTYTTTVGSYVRQSLTATNGHNFYYTNLSQKDNTTGGISPVFTNIVGALASTTSPFTPLTNEYSRNSVILNVNTTGAVFFQLGRVAGNSLINVDEHGLYNLTALGITATKEQLDFWYSVWQQNHKLGMRVHRASGNDIPLAVLNNQSLNQVFVGGQLVTNGDFSNGTTNWTGTSFGTTLSTISVSNNILTGTGTNSSDVNLARTLVSNTRNGNKYYFISRARVLDTTDVVSLWLQEGAGFLGGSVVQQINSPIQNQWYNLSGVITQTLSADPYNADIRVSYTSAATSNGKQFQIDYLFVFNTTALGIATLTKSQLDYLYQVWQFNQVNALVARQFIQEA